MEHEIMMKSGACVVALICAFTDVASADECSELAKFARSGLTVDRAEQVSAGELKVRSLPSSPESTLKVPAFCRVAATLRPSADSNIKMEIWLPPNWNTKLVSVGNGGWNGMISYSAMVAPLERGYAVASTDTGHVGDSMDGSFAYGHPEKLIDFGWRAVHEMTVASKAIIAAYYEPQLTRAYWNGC